MDQIPDPSSKYRYYKEIKAILSRCSVCNDWWHTPVYGWRKTVKFCNQCIGKFYKMRYSTVRKPYYEALSPEEKKKFRQKWYPSWKRWVREHLTERRKLALKSYHKNKIKDAIRQARKERRKKEYQKFKQRKIGLSIIHGLQS